MANMAKFPKSGNGGKSKKKPQSRNVMITPTKFQHDFAMDLPKMHAKIVTNPDIIQYDIITIDAFQFSNFPQIFIFFEFLSLQVARKCQEVVTFKSVMTGLWPSSHR